MIIDVSPVANPMPTPVDPLIEAFKLGLVPAGPSGAAATIEVGTVTTLDPDQPATVTNVGTGSAAVFNFGIPKGPPDDSGLDPGQNLADVENAAAALANLGGAPAATTYTKSEVDGFLDDKANSADVYSKTQADAALADLASDVSEALDDVEVFAWFMGSM